MRGMNPSSRACPPRSSPCLSSFPPQRRIRHAHRSRPPAFTPVKRRERKGGWSAKVQCAFLAALYLTGSVNAAAARVGRSRESAYRLRRAKGGESFAAAWDRILAPGDPAPTAGSPPAHDCPQSRPQSRSSRKRVADWRKVTLSELIWRVEIGLWRPVIYRGKWRGIARKPDNSALLRLLSRLDRKTGHGSGAPA